MRYADSGGLSAEACLRREVLQLEATSAFQVGEESRAIVARLWVTRKSVNEWRRFRREGGAGALLSRSLGGTGAGWPKARSGLSTAVVG